MRKFITFGKSNKNYKFVILTCVFLILTEFLPSFLANIFLHYELITENVKDIEKHSIFLATIILLGMFVFSGILFKYEQKLSKKESIICKPNNSNNDKGCFKSIQINEEKKRKNK